MRKRLIIALAAVALTGCHHASYPRYGGAPTSIVHHVFHGAPVYGGYPRPFVRHIVVHHVHHYRR